MQGDVVRAAKWLGGSIVASCLICVVGFHPAVTGRTIHIQKVDPRPADDSPVPPAPVHFHPDRAHGPATLAPPAPGRCDVFVPAPVDVPPAQPFAIQPPPSMSPADRVERTPAVGVCGLSALPPPCLPVTPTGGGMSSVYMGWGVGE